MSRIVVSRTVGKCSFSGLFKNLLFFSTGHQQQCSSILDWLERSGKTRNLRLGPWYRSVCSGKLRGWTSRTSMTFTSLTTSLKLTNFRYLPCPPNEIPFSEIEVGTWGGGGGGGGIGGTECTQQHVGKNRRCQQTSRLPFCWQHWFLPTHCEVHSVPPVFPKVPTFGDTRRNSGTGYSAFEIIVAPS